MSKVSLVNSSKDDVSNVDQEVNSFMNNYKEAAIIEDDEEEEEEEEEIVSSSRPEPEVIDDPVINGLTMLTIIDMVLPSLILFAYKKITKKKSLKVPMSKLQLTRKQKTDLEKLADRVAAKIKFADGDPTLILIISMGSMYYANLINVVHDIETS